MKFQFRRLVEFIDQQGKLQNCIFNDALARIELECETFFCASEKLHDDRQLLLERSTTCRVEASHNWRWNEKWKNRSTQLEQNTVDKYLFIDTEASSEIFKCLLRSLQVSITLLFEWHILNFISKSFFDFLRLPGGGTHGEECKVVRRAVGISKKTKREMCNEMEWNDNKYRYQTTDSKQQPANVSVQQSTTTRCKFIKN